MNFHNQVDLKIVLLGGNAVGKTCLVERFANDRFAVSPAATIGSAFISRKLQVNDKSIVLGIWDTAGAERYYSMTKFYYRGAQAAIVCYDVTRPETFEMAKHWVQELKTIEENCKIYICATKKDLMGYDDNREVEGLENVEKYANGVLSKFYITSSKTGENVAELFQDIATDCAPMIAKQDARRAYNQSSFISLSQNKKRSKCCPLGGDN